MQQMVIANALRDGLVVFLAADGRWVNAIADGAVASKTNPPRRLPVFPVMPLKRAEYMGLVQ